MANSKAQSIGKHIVEFKDRSSMKQYIKSETIKCGFKFWLKYDSKAEYLSELERSTNFNHLDTEGGVRGVGVVRWTPVGMFLLFFSYLLNFGKQWHLCKFLILGDLATHPFGLLFPCPTSEKMKVGVHWTPPSVVLRWDFLKLYF